MKHRIFYFILPLLCLGMCFASCDPNDEPNHGPSFEGTYSLIMTYDSITTDDGTWFSNEELAQITGQPYETEHGYMTVTKENNRYHMVATLVNDETAEEVTYFDTYATESNGILNMENSSVTAPSGVVINFSFRNFANNMPDLFFKGLLDLSLFGTDYYYVISFNGTKQQ